MTLTFKQVSKINRERSEQWHNGGIDSWSVSDWGVAMAGEAGEVCDAIKKLNRLRDGLQRKEITQEKAIEDIAKEIADTYLYLDLLSQRLRINMEEAIVQKFNEVSVKYGFPQRLTND